MFFKVCYLLGILIIFPTAFGKSALPQKIESLTLVNADTGQDIEILRNGSSLNLATLPSRSLNIRANTLPADVGSVVFSLSGAQTHTQVETRAVYALFGGDVDYSSWTPSLGNYKLKVTPYTQARGKGTAGASLEINFNVIDELPPRVEKFYLINPETNARLRELTDGSTLNLSLLPSRAFSIEAVTVPTITGSVKFDLDGLDNFKTENTPPYALGGDRAGNFSPLELNIGKHSLVATPFSRSDKSGLSGQALRVNFTIIDIAPPKVTALRIINTDTNQPMMDLKEGQVLDLSDLPSRNFTFQAVTEPTIVGGVKFGLNGNSNYRVEKGAPYSISGDRGGVFSSLSIGLGSHHVVAQAFSESSVSGLSSEPLSINFSIIETPPAKIIGFKLINTDSNQELGSLVEGQTINLALLPTKNISVKAVTEPTSVGSVVFNLDSTTSYHIADSFPYSISGSENGKISPWNVVLGNHSITAIPFSKSKGTGIQGESGQVNFSIINKSPQKIGALTLVDAADGSPLATVEDGMVLNLAKLRTRNFSLRADTIPAIVGSVQFSLNDERDYQLENRAPYAIRGDSNGTYTPWALTPGEYNLSVRPFTESKASGSEGESVNVKFTVIDQEPARINSLTLVNASNGEDIKLLADGETINLATLPSRNISLRANANDVTKSVKFKLSGETGEQLENALPFSLKGDRKDGSYNSWTPELGSHSLAVTPYEKSNAEGEAGQVLLVKFQVIDERVLEILGDSSLPYDGKGFGHLIESGGHANTRYKEMHSFRFMAEHTGNLDAIRVWIKTNLGDSRYEKSNPLEEITGYSLGAGGTVRWEIREDDGTANHFPSEKILGMTDKIVQPRLSVTLSKHSRFRRLDLLKPVRLEKGKIYHIISRQLDPANGEISVNDVFSRRGGAQFSPYAPYRNILASIRYSKGEWNVREGFYPMFDLMYQDGVNKGSNVVFDPAYNKKTYVDDKAQARLYVNVDSDRVINKIYAAIVKDSANATGSLVMRLRKSNGSGSDDGTILKTIKVSASQLHHIEPGTEVKASGDHGSYWVKFDLGEDIKIEANSIYYVEFSGEGTNSPFSMTSFTKGSSFGFEDDKGESGVYGQSRSSNTGSWQLLERKFQSTGSKAVTIPIFGIHQ